jgi:hypothetical protein
VVDEDQRNIPFREEFQLAAGLFVVQVGAHHSAVHTGVGGHLQLVPGRFDGVDRDDRPGFRRRPLGSGDDLAEEGIPVLRKVQGKVVQERSRGGSGPLDDRRRTCVSDIENAKIDKVPKMTMPILTKLSLREYSMSGQRLTLLAIKEIMKHRFIRKDR